MGYQPFYEADLSNVFPIGRSGAVTAKPPQGESAFPWPYTAKQVSDALLQMAVTCKVGAYYAPAPEPDPTLAYTTPDGYSVVYPDLEREHHD